MGEGRVVQSVDRAVDLLEVIADHGGAASLTEIAAASGLPQGTIHRLLNTLVRRGYAHQLPSRRYTLGPQLIRHGAIAGRQLGLGARPQLERLT